MSLDFQNMAIINKIDISVCICTLNPQEDLFLMVIEALRNQSFPEGRWEIIIVDNGSDYSLKEKFEHNFLWHPNVRFCFEPTRGFAYSRRKAINEARGKIVVWVDDDCILDSNYLTEANYLCEEYPQVGIFTGSVQYLAQDGADVFAKRMYEYMSRNSTFLGFYTTKDSSRYTIATRGGPGMIMRKEIGEKYVDDFWRYERIINLLRPYNLPSLSYEDIDLDMTALQLGFELGRSGSLVLVHMAHVSELKIEKMASRAYKLGFNNELFELRWGWHKIENNIITIIKKFVWDLVHSFKSIDHWLVNSLYFLGVLKARLALAKNINLRENFQLVIPPFCL